MYYLTPCIDTDIRFIQYLDPPSILNLSEVNMHYNKLTDYRRSVFNRIKYNLKEAVEFNTPSTTDLEQLNQSYFELDPVDRTYNPTFTADQAANSGWMLKWILQKIHFVIKYQVQIFSVELHQADIISLMCKSNNILLLDYVQTTMSNERLCQIINYDTFTLIFGNFFNTIFYEQILKLIGTSSIRMEFTQRNEFLVRLINAHKYIQASYFYQYLEKWNPQYYASKMSVLPIFASAMRDVVPISDDVSNYSSYVKKCFMFFLDSDPFGPESKPFDHGNILNILCSGFHFDCVKKYISYADQNNVDLSPYISELFEKHIYDVTIFEYIATKYLTYFKSNVQKLFACPCKKYYRSVEFIDLIIKLCKTHDIELDIHYEEEIAFRIACRHHDERIVNHLLKLGEETYGKIDIHAHNEDAFIYSISTGCFNRCKLLIELGENGYGLIDVHVNSDQALVLLIKRLTNGSTSLNYLVDMVNFLLSLDTEKYGPYPPELVDQWNKELQNMIDMNKVD